MSARTRTALLAAVVTVAFAVLVAGWLAGAVALLATGTGAALVFALVMDDREKHWHNMAGDLRRLAADLQAEADSELYTPSAYVPDAYRRSAYLDAAQRVRLVIAAAMLDPDHHRRHEESAA